MDYGEEIVLMFSLLGSFGRGFKLGELGWVKRGSCLGRTGSFG